MTKKILTLALYAIFVLLIASLLVQVLHRQRKNKAIATQKQMLPDFTFHSLDGSVINRAHFTDGEPVCLIYLDPDCGFCAEEVKDIVEHIEDFGRASILLVSHVDTARLRQFADEFQLEAHPQIVLLHDRNYRFVDWFGRAVAPSVYIYDQDHRLVREYQGQTKVEAITKWL